MTIGIVYIGGPAPGYSGQLVPGAIYLKGPGTDTSQQVPDGQSATFMVQPGDYTASARSGDARCTEMTVKVTAHPVGTGSPWLVRCDVR